MNINSRVKIKYSPYDGSELAVGQTGVVVEMDEHYVDVRMDNGYARDGDDLWPFMESELEVIE